MVTLRLPGHRPRALPTRHTAVRLRGQDGVVLLQPRERLVGAGEAPGVDHNTVAGVGETSGNWKTENMQCWTKTRSSTWRFQQFFFIDIFLQVSIDILQPSVILDKLGVPACRVNVWVVAVKVHTAPSALHG